MKPTIGRIVHYKLSESDAAAINVRRRDFRAFEASHEHPHKPGTPPATGHIAHYGNDVAAGDVFPAAVVRVWDDGKVNLQVFLDGNDAFWATSREQGEEPGCWEWPQREAEAIFAPVSPGQQEAALTKRLH
jgi:hypothetical protein